jgi:predicted HNH restriction endonuclease
VGGKSIQAHHLWNFFDHEELRFDVDNGITLCAKCHRQFHREFGIKNNTPEELELFMLTDAGEE